jgi:hypothetical protein
MMEKGVMREKDWLKAAAIDWLARVFMQGRAWLELTMRNMSSLCSQRNDRRLSHGAHDWSCRQAGDSGKQAKKKGNSRLRSDSVVVIWGAAAVAWECQ